MMRRHVCTGMGALTAAVMAMAFTACSSNPAAPPAVEPDAASPGQPDATSPGQPDATSPGQGPPSPDAGSGVDTGASASDGGDAGPACVAYDASALDDAGVAAGFAAIFDVYHCYSCHQNPSQKVTDAGLGIVLSGNNMGLGDSGTLFPPNLTNDPATGLGCWTDQQVQDAILDGKDNQGNALCAPMPVYSHALTTADGGIRAGTPMDAGTAQAIIAFLRSLPPVVNQVTDTTCPSDAGAGGD